MGVMVRAMSEPRRQARGLATARRLILACLLAATTACGAAAAPGPAGAAAALESQTGGGGDFFGSDETPQAGLLLPGDAARGERVYRTACAPCHGATGTGDGPAGAYETPLPRDFTRANYRYRSTATGSLPTDADLLRTVQSGLPGTAMPAWGERLDGQQIADVIARIKSFSGRFVAEGAGRPVALALPVPATPTSLKRGAAAWKQLKCARCHGERGRGDGSAATEDMRDDGGHVMLPRDFTRGVYAGGGSRRALFRTLITGLDGTPMPSYAGSATPALLMDLVNHLIDLERERGWTEWLTEDVDWHEPGEQRLRR